MMAEEITTKEQALAHMRERYPDDPQWQSYDLNSKPAAVSVPEKAPGDFTAADQATDYPMPEKPSALPRLGVDAAAVAAAAASQGKNILNFNEIPEKYKIRSSIPNTGSIGKPLTNWELMSQPGQIAEMERVKMRDLLDDWRSASGAQQGATQGLRTQSDAAQRALEQTRSEEQIALANHVAINGGKTAPPSRIESARASLGSPPTPPADVVNYHDMNPATPAGGSAAREISQHEAAHYRSISQGEQMQMVDRLSKELGLGKDYVKIMLEAGEHAPSVTGRVLLPVKTMNAINAEQTPAQQTLATLTPEELAKREITAQRMASRSLARDIPFNESERLLKEAQAGRTSAASDALSVDKKLLEALSLRNVLHQEHAPAVETQQARMIEKRGALPTLGPAVNMISRAAPIVGHIANVAGSADLGYESFQRQQNHDPVGAVIAGVGSVGQVPTWLRPTIANALAGIGIDIGTRAGLNYYDNHAHEIHQFLQKKLGLPESFDPTQYSVMDNYGKP